MQRLTDALDILRNRMVDLTSRFIAHLPELETAVRRHAAGNRKGNSQRQRDDADDDTGGKVGNKLVTIVGLEGGE
jgi:hypothetical protein